MKSLSLRVLIRRVALRFSLAGVLALCAPAGRLSAHEGHEALPSTGATVHGDELLLSPAAIAAVGLKLEPVTIGDMTRRLHVNARVELPARQQARVATLVPGRVTQVLARPGDAVQAGQPLARIESLELESLQSDLLQAAARLELLRRTVRQQQDLTRAGAVAGHELLAMQAELRQQEAQSEITRRKLNGLGLDEAALDRVLETGEPAATVAVVSPISGRVEQADVRPGQLVESTDQLFYVVDLSRVYLVGGVVETDAHQIAAGQPARASFAGLPGGDVTGRIDHVRLHLDEERRVLEVVVAVDNAGSRLRPGLFGRMSLEVAAHKQQVLCPAGALIRAGGQNWVLRRTGRGRFKRQPVTIGARTRQYAVIETGVFPGQEVIVTPTHLLAAMFDGDRPTGGGRSASRTLAASGSPGVRAASTNAGGAVTAARATVELPTGRQAYATSLIEGRVARLLVEPGNEVRGGQVVAELHSQPLRNMQLDLLEARSRLYWIEDAVERLEPLARGGLAARQELWEREADRKALRSQINGLGRKLSLVGVADENIQALAQVDAAAGTGEPPLRATIVDTVLVRAPFDGVVARVGVVPGELVHAHDHVVEIVDAAAVWIRAWVFERDAARVQEGQVAVVRFPSDPSLRRSGRVVRVGPALVSADRVLPVWIEVSNPDGFLKAGMLARVVIHAAQPAGELADRDGP